MAKKLDNFEFRSDEVKDILSKVPSVFVLWGNSVILFILFLIIALAYFIRYPDVLESEAVITTSIEPAKEYAIVNAKFEEILVKNDDEIKAGDILTIFESTADSEDIFKVNTMLDTLAVDSFKENIHKIPLNLNLGEVSQAYSTFINAFTQLLLVQDYDDFEVEKKTNYANSLQIKKRLKNLESQRKKIADELELKKKDLVRFEVLFNKGVISEQEYEKNQVEFSQIERNHITAESSLLQLKESLNNTKLISGQLTSGQIRNRLILETNYFNSLNNLKTAIKDWERKFLIISRLNGKVSLIPNLDENQTMKVDELVLTVIPEENSSYVAILKLPSLNSGKIRIGQVVNLKLNGYPDYEFGVLKGTVKNISNITNDEGFYIVNVSLPDELITTFGKRLIFRQEMPANAEIITEDLRLIERIFNKLRKIILN